MVTNKEEQDQDQVTVAKGSDESFSINSDDLNCFTADGGFRRDVSPRVRSVLGLLGIALIAMFMYGYDGEVIENDIIHTEDTVSKYTAGAGTSNSISSSSTTVFTPLDPNKCNSVCTIRKNNRDEKYGGDLLNREDVLRLAKNGFEKLLDSIKEDTGEYFESIFTVQPPVINITTTQDKFKYQGTVCPTPECLSYDRMKRKLKLKVLKMMDAIQKSESNVQGCDCIKNEGEFMGAPHDNSVYDAPDFYETYVYANGGHSSAAGHGNKFSESYTAVAGRDMRHVWESIGIQMIDRNHAMGGQVSFPIPSRVDFD